MGRAENTRALLDRMLTGATKRGLLMRTATNSTLDGRIVEVDGHRLVNFGACSYLGLEHHAEIVEAICTAARDYGSQFSASRTYLQAPGYLELEALLADMFGGHVLVTPTTTLGHKIALPVLIASSDAAVLDYQVHASVKMAGDHLRVQGTRIETLPHNDLDALEEAVERLSPRHERVWYLADGVYSMFADPAPFAELALLLDRHPRLHLYIDDAHGVSWSGRHGRGLALEHLGGHERVIVAGSLNKSFAAAGGVVVFPNEELRRRARTLGAPMIFSGPIQPPMLGAAIASARIHLSAELVHRQQELRERMVHCNELLDGYGIEPASRALTPIRYIKVGLPVSAEALMERLKAAGFLVNLGILPAVPSQEAGVRFTLSNHVSFDDIESLVATLAAELRRLGRAPGEQRSAGLAGTSDRPTGRAGETAWTFEHYTSCDELDAAEWDGLLGARGTFTVAGLRFLERAFPPDAARREDRWSFHYYIVRDADRRPVLATFFTTALWKHDALDSAALSRLVEEQRVQDPYRWTERRLCMGSPLTEGDHLYLDRNANWTVALDLLVDAVAEQAHSDETPTIAFRDLDADDTELEAALLQRGYARAATLTSWALEPVLGDDAQWLESLSARSRRHQDREVLPWEERFDVEVLRRGGRIPAAAELGHLHQLYRNVRDQNLEINAFELPDHLFCAMLETDVWELVLLRLRGAGAPGEPVAVGAAFTGAGHYVPMIVGLDYAYVGSHRSYRQMIRQMQLRARAHGARAMLLGIGAPLEKHRFGARPQRRHVYAQTSDHYSQEVMAALEAQAAGAR